jgi:hypothetical protein
VTGNLAGPDAAQAAAHAPDPAALDRWRAVHGAGDLQFTPPAPWHPAPPPPWLETFGRWLADLFRPVARLFGSSWPWVEKGLVVLVLLLALWLVWSLLRPLFKRRGVKPVVDDTPPWAPSGEEAVALLRDAENLAASGDFDGATHLLLRRSVAQLAAARPGLVHPASTAREIADMAPLPDSARTAFATIAGRVEASRYALRALAEGDWLAARDAYAAFARISLTGLRA